MSGPLDVSADLDIEVGGRHMRLTGQGSQLTLTTDGLPSGKRSDAGRLAALLESSGVHVAIVDPRGRPLGEVGSGVRSWVGRLFAGSSAIRPKFRLLFTRRG